MSEWIKCSDSMPREFVRVLIELPELCEVEAAHWDGSTQQWVTTADVYGPEEVPQWCPIPVLR